MAGLAAPIGQKAAIAADFQCRWLTRPLHPEREFRVPPFAVWARPRQFTGFDGEQVRVRRFRVPSTACGFGAYSRSVDANLPLLGTAVSCDTLSGGLRSNLSVPGRGREGLESALPRRYRVFWGRSLHRTDSGHSPWQREPLFVPPLALATPLAHSSGRSSTSPTTGGGAKSPLMQIWPAVSGAS